MKGALQVPATFHNPMISGKNSEKRSLPNWVYQNSGRRQQVNCQNADWYAAFHEQLVLRHLLFVQQFSQPLTDRLIELHSITIPVAVAHEKSRP